MESAPGFKRDRTTETGFLKSGDILLDVHEKSCLSSGARVHEPTMLGRWPSRIQHPSFWIAVIDCTSLRTRLVLLIKNTNSFYLEECVNEVSLLCEMSEEPRPVCVIVGVNERGMISKGTGECRVSSFATLVKTQKKRYLQHDNFISHTTLLRYEKTLAYNIALHILSSSVLTRLSSRPSTVYLEQ